MQKQRMSFNLNRANILPGDQPCVHDGEGPTAHPEQNQDPKASFPQTFSFFMFLCLFPGGAASYPSQG